MKNAGSGTAVEGTGPQSGQVGGGAGEIKEGFSGEGTLELGCEG